MLRPQGLGTEAELAFSDSEFQIIRPGTFVRCAVTGTPIPLEDLRYWNAAVQEAYSGPEAVLKRLKAKPSA